MALTEATVTVDVQGGVDVVEKLVEELRLTDELLNAANAVLDLIPDCPVHGPKCRPYQEQWVLARLSEQDKGDTNA